MCNSLCSTHLGVELHCLSSPPALVLFVDSIKQMVREPITQEGAGVWICMCFCVHVPSPHPWALQVSLGFLVTLSLGGERVGDN